MSTPSLFSLVLLLLAVLFVHSEAASSRCQEVRDPGDASCGKKSATRFYFDHRTERCQPFLYQGCAGNRNRFFNRTECESACADADGSAPTYERKVCKNGVYAAVDAQGVALDCDSCPSGFSCENSACCGSKDAVCKQTYDAGKFGSGGVMTPRSSSSSNYHGSR